MNAPPLYALLAEFDSPEDLLEATRSAKAEGFRRMDAFAPFPVEGLAAALGQRKTPMSLICLAGAVTGGVGGYFLQDFAMAVSYPLNIAGRPLHSVIPFIPITFELTILCAALATGFGMLALNGLPRLHHPVFGAPGFERASSDRFFLLIEAADPQFQELATAGFLTKLHASRVTRIAHENPVG